MNELHFFAVRLDFVDMKRSPAIEGNYRERKMQRTNRIGYIAPNG